MYLMMQNILFDQLKMTLNIIITVWDSEKCHLFIFHKYSFYY